MTIRERNERQAAYAASPKGKAVRAAYAASPAGKATKAKFQLTPASKAYQRRYQAAYYLIVTRRKRLKRLKERASPCN